MTEYLIKSGSILIILLAIYHIWLEKEKMHHFNRFFLLLSIVFGLTVPLISLEVSSNNIKAIELPVMDRVTGPLANTFPVVTSQVPDVEYNYWPFIIYGIVALLLLIKFVGNLISLRLKVIRNLREKTDHGTIVMIKGKVIPHSFLSYTFLNEEEYLNNHIEDEIIRHEFAHIRQKHSADLLFVELLKIIFWFNPVFLLYKKAIQLNHEFLADEAVIKSSNNVSAYQQILLQRVSLTTVNLASNLNYSVTKKRFKMMKKQTSRTWKMIKGLSLFPVAAILILTFSNQIFADADSVSLGLKANLTVSNQISKDKFYGGGIVRFKNSSGEMLTKKYEALTTEEKKLFPAPLVPTKALFETWQDTYKFIILIGYQKIKESISDLKPGDFVTYYSVKSPTDSKTYVNLIKADWLEDYKKYGGIFRMDNEGLILIPPPPIVTPAKN
ncbi:MAG: M56 family metallopeptidase [Pedobacter sp.]|jgi:hypothetical protein